MKLYDFEPAPNPRRVRIFLAEKGIEIPSVQINTREREQFSPDFIKINPYSIVPVLELDDGTCIGESIAICRYIEDLHPEPSLFGRDARERAIVEMWNLRAESDGISAAGEILRNALPIFEGRAIAGVPDGFPQIPALVERGKKRMTRFFEFWDRQLGDNDFVCGSHFSIADITSYIAIDFVQRAEVTIPAHCSNVARWHAEVAQRPSIKA
jgi:glutathione S-transferase